ncbi:MAG: GNAT family N-acetyltransferase [Clostridia bacterium]|nr:GNAT family N-acetyltransferase [Clostridia bacterium]
MNEKEKMSFTVRELGASDESLVNEFFDAMGGESRALFNRRDYNRRGALKYCRTKDKTRRYYVFLSEEKIAGYVFFLDFHTTVPELGIALRDELAGQGIGGELMRFAIDTAREAGAGGIQLTTHVANVRAQALYEKHGFECRGLTKNGMELFYLLKFIK